MKEVFAVHFWLESAYLIRCYSLEPVEGLSFSPMVEEVGAVAKKLGLVAEKAESPDEREDLDGALEMRQPR